jgi:hypothetical protein
VDGYDGLIAVYVDINNTIVSTGQRTACRKMRAQCEPIEGAAR